VSCSIVVNRQPGTTTSHDGRETLVHTTCRMHLLEALASPPPRPGRRGGARCRWDNTHPPPPRNADVFLGGRDAPLLISLLSQGRCVRRRAAVSRGALVTRAIKVGDKVSGRQPWNPYSTRTRIAFFCFSPSMRRHPKPLPILYATAAGGSAAILRHGGHAADSRALR